MTSSRSLPSVAARHTASWYGRKSEKPNTSWSSPRRAWGGVGGRGLRSGREGLGETSEGLGRAGEERGGAVPRGAAAPAPRPSLGGRGVFVFVFVDGMGKEGGTL